MGGQDGISGSDEDDIEVTLHSAFVETSPTIPTTSTTLLMTRVRLLWLLAVVLAPLSWRVVLPPYLLPPRFLVV